MRRHAELILFETRSTESRVSSKIISAFLRASAPPRSLGVRYLEAAAVTASARVSEPS